MVLFDQLHKPCGAEELAFAVRGLRDSVRMKHKNVSRIERNSPFVVSAFFENAQRKTRDLDLAAASFLVKQWLRLPGVCHSKLLPALTSNGELRSILETFLCFIRAESRRPRTAKASSS